MSGLTYYRPANKRRALTQKTELRILLVVIAAIALVMLGVLPVMLLDGDVRLNLAAAEVQR